MHCAGVDETVHSMNAIMKLSTFDHNEILINSLCTSKDLIYRNGSKVLLMASKKFAVLASFLKWTTFLQANSL